MVRPRAPVGSAYMSWTLHRPQHGRTDGLCSVPCAELTDGLGRKGESPKAQGSLWFRGLPQDPVSLIAAGFASGAQVFPSPLVALAIAVSQERLSTTADGTVVLEGGFRLIL